MANLSQMGSELDASMPQSILPDNPIKKKCRIWVIISALVTNIYWHLSMVQIQTMTNYDHKKSKIFISLNVLLKEIWNMMICAFSLSRRSYLCFKPICHKLLSQLTRIDWCLTLQIALQADQFPRRVQSLVPNFPLKVAHPNSSFSATFFT